MRQIIILLSVLLGAAAPAFAQVSIGIGMPSVSIGINLPVFPRFEMVPGYPVYYAPQVDSNYFFYDGMYWVYQEDNWYASSWYNGPWALVSPIVVPVYILRVPVRYYRQPPIYFRGWRQDAPPRWGDHWGNDWERQRSGWDHWNRSSVPPPAPLPTYQQQYSGRHYPPPEQQRVIANQNYHYQPHDPVVKQHFDKYEAPTAAAVSPRDRTQQESQSQSRDAQHQQTPQTEPQHQTQPREAQHQPPQSGEAQRQPPQPGVQHQPQEAREPQHEPPQSERQRQPQQQAPEDRDHGPPGGEKAAKQPKPEQGREEDRDNGAGKEGQQDNR
jgi:hypothetical protein